MSDQAQSAASASDHPWLVADIGGTNARFGLVRQPGAAVSDVRAAKGREHASPQAAAQAYLSEVLGPGQTVGRAALAVAAPLTADPIVLTNSPWQVSRAALCQALQLRPERLMLLNDFEALAQSLPGLQGPDLRSIGPGPESSAEAGAEARAARLTKAVVGPGTGLGVAGCVPVPGSDRWIALPAEGGHVTLCAADGFEAAVLQALRPAHPHLSAERLLSGSGLPTLHRGVCLVNGWDPSPLAPEEITRRGLAASTGDADTAQAAAAATLDTFCAMLGTFAGNVALTLGARGGLYVAGGIAAILADRLVTSRFRERFEAKGRFRAYLSPVQTALVVAPHAALSGAAAALSQSDWLPGRIQ